MSTPITPSPALYEDVLFFSHYGGHTSSKTQPSDTHLTYTILLTILLPSSGLLLPPLPAAPLGYTIQVIPPTSTLPFVNQSSIFHDAIHILMSVDLSSKYLIPQDRFPPNTTPGPARHRHRHHLTSHPRTVYLLFPGLASLQGAGSHN